MSYSSDTKEELCRLEPESVCCLLAERVIGRLGDLPRRRAEAPVD